MNLLKILPLFILVAMPISLLHAQIYQSKDANGNTVFSDKPSADAAEIDLQQTNSANSVKDSPRPAPQAAPREQGPSEQGGDNVIINEYNDGYGGRGRAIYANEKYDDRRRDELEDRDRLPEREGDREHRTPGIKNPGGGGGNPGGPRR
ncbi:MAG: DUF4124 domain-containing protein [Pseudomonadales bacterium]